MAYTDDKVVSNCDKSQQCCLKYAADTKNDMPPSLINEPTIPCAISVSILYHCVRPGHQYTFYS